MMEPRNTDTNDGPPRPEAFEDEPGAYSWANLHGGKNRDFSASRREYRAQLRHRAGQQERAPGMGGHAEAGYEGSIANRKTVQRGRLRCRPRVRYRLFRRRRPLQTRDGRAGRRMRWTREGAPLKLRYKGRLNRRRRGWRHLRPLCLAWRSRLGRRGSMILPSRLLRQSLCHLCRRCHLRRHLFLRLPKRCSTPGNGLRRGGSR